MKIEIQATNDENFILNPKNYAEIQPEPKEEVTPAPKLEEEVVETPQPQPPAPPTKIGVPFHNQVESMKWL